MASVRMTIWTVFCCQMRIQSSVRAASALADLDAASVPVSGGGAFGASTVTYLSGSR